MYPLLVTLAAVASVIFCYVSLLFVLSLIVKRNDIADVGWGMGIVLVGWTSFLLGAVQGVHLMLMLVLVSIWGVRLSARILLRNLGKEEDARYRAWRESWEWFYVRSYLQVYLLQGLLMIVVGYPLVHVAAFGASGALGMFALVGLLVWCIGFYFEVVGDYELDSFIKKKKRGETDEEILRSGLWRYSRHPNYFGEVTMWWGVWLIALASPYGLAAAIGPLMITFLILKVSGVPMLEKQFDGNPAFEEYKKRTSVFIPLPPREVGS